MQLTAGASRTEEYETSIPNQYQWSQHVREKGATDRLASYGEFKNQGYDKSTRLQDGNVTTASVNSNSSEISRGMEKISEKNQLMAQKQITQQRVLQALLLHQEQSNETLEAAQRVQIQALRAPADATEQRGFDALFNRITKFDGKDPQKCHFWLNQVHVVCLESGRNFRQVLMFCAKDTVLSVLSGLSPGLSDEEVKEEMMRCFSPIPMRRQAIEMMRIMCQEDDEQMCQYIVRHEVAHERVHRLSPDDQLSLSKIIEFAMTLQPFIQDKLLKRIDGDRPSRSLQEAYHQALDMERKNQIMKRYKTSTPISQISDCTFGEDMEEIDAMELCPRDNIKKIFHGNDRGNRNFGPVGRGSFGRGSQYVSQERRQNLENNPKGVGRGFYNQGQNRTFHSKYQDGSKPTKWDATF